MNALMFGVDRSGNQVPLLVGTDGALNFEPATTPWNYAAATGGITNTSAVTLAAAAGAGLVNYLTSLQLHNTSATGTEVTITDGSTSTVLARFYAPASMTAPMAITFPNALASSTNSALCAACVTTGTVTYINAQGYTDAPVDILSANATGLLYLLDDNGEPILDGNNNPILAN